MKNRSKYCIYSKDTGHYQVYCLSKEKPFFTVGQIRIVNEEVCNSCVHFKPKDPLKYFVALKRR